MVDAMTALEARLASLETNGFKLNPATANPGEHDTRRQPWPLVTASMALPVGFRQQGARFDHALHPGGCQDPAL